jgi:hypothetical protein
MVLRLSKARAAVKAQGLVPSKRFAAVAKAASEVQYAQLTRNALIFMSAHALLADAAKCG